MNTIMFTCHDDGSITADGFPERIEFWRELLETQPYSDAFRRQGDRLYINAANGDAVYLLVDEERAFRDNVLRGVRLYSRMLPE